MANFEKPHEAKYKTDTTHAAPLASIARPTLRSILDGFF